MRRRLFPVLLPVTAMVLAFIAGMKAFPAPRPTSSLKIVGKKTDDMMQVVEDADHGVVCYVIESRTCIGDCAYSPAISCVAVTERESR